jgi:SAM-dependent methyltransferase
MTGTQIFNTTSLREAHHGQTVHRDYIAHAFRWSVAQRHINEGDVVIDVGCGPDTPLVKVLAFPRGSVPKRYTGIDLNNFVPKTRPQWANFILGVSVFDLDPVEVGPADVVVCFEMLEHMPKPKGLELLRWLREAVKPSGIILLSTPSYAGGDLPKNHVHEWTYDELKEGLASVWLEVNDVWGTFMRIPQLRKAVAVQYPDLAKVLGRLDTYYSHEALSTIFAPLFPGQASNCLWKLKRLSIP